MRTNTRGAVGGSLGFALAMIAAGLLGACGSAPLTPDAGHLRPTPSAADAAPAAPIPAPVLLPPVPPAPQAADTVARYTVVVRQVPVQELLQAVARDARVNIDIHPAVTGVVSLNAVDQTLPQILQRITRQTGARFRMDGPNLVVEPDTPFLRTYTIDYVNASRSSEADIGASSQVSALSASGTAGDSGGTGSSEKVTTRSQHRFWETLVQNLKDLLREQAEPRTGGSAAQHLVETGPGIGAAGGSGAYGAAGGGVGAPGGAAAAGADRKAHV